MRVAVAGLGLMGEPIARRLLAAGHPLTVFNRTRERTEPFAADGASVAVSVGDVWATADVCVTMVTGDDALLGITLGDEGLLARGHGKVLVDMSTVSPDVSREVAGAADAAGVGFLRAPVSGNPGVVRSGNLTIIVSGDRTTFESMKQLLRDIGPNVYYVGDGEQARVVKLALNLMIAGTAELVSEAVLFGEASGLDRDAMLEVIGGSAAGSPFVKYKTAPLVARDYTTTFSLANMHKDLAMALAAAGQAGVTLPTTEQIDGLVQECMAQGMAETDLMGLLLHLQAKSGVPTDVPL
jgi:3-hydroxyisobutyrate dehydrogenase-like beta-hydroxyacid dehydrogenase